MNNNEIRACLNGAREEKYAMFNVRLIPETGAEIIGVRMPILRTIAKQIMKDGDMSILVPEPDECHEKILLRGMVIGFLKIEFAEKMKLVAAYVPSISNWALCDSFCSALKIVSKDLAEYRRFLTKYVTSKKEYEIRFAVISMMTYYLDDEYIDDTLEVFADIKSDKYYVKMAVAWAISLAFIKQRDKTMAILVENRLDKFTQNKSIQKICESFRVSDQDKNLVKTLKNK